MTEIDRRPAALLSLLGFGLAAAAATGAAAHVTVSPPQAVAGTAYTGAFRVGHGCAGAPTTALRVEFPEGLAGVKPQAKAGWTLQVERESLSAPSAGEGGRLVTQRVKAIIWRGALADEAFDDFGFMAQLPATPGPLYFTAVQTCDTVVERWAETPEPGQSGHGLRRPAPVLTLVAAGAPGPVAEPRAETAKAPGKVAPKPVAAPALPAGVKLVDGAFLTAAGAPLYVFKHDTMVGMSHCEGACAGAWPPLLAPKDAKAPKDWSKVERADGAYQWAFQEHPLYTTTRTGDALAAALGPDGAWSPARLSPPK